jgi:AAA domain-containing protein
MLPLRYAYRNVLIGHSREAAALYRAATVDYPFLPDAEKWAELRKVERFAHLVGADFSLWRVQRASTAPGEYAAKLQTVTDDRHADPAGWRAYAEGHEARLAELGGHTPELYVAVSLADRQGGAGAGFLRSLDRARRRLEGLAGVGAPRPLSGSELQSLVNAERRLFDRLAPVLNLERASTSELQWLLKRSMSRGIAEPDIDPHWQPAALVVDTPDGAPAYEPAAHDLWRFSNAVMSENPAEPPALTVEGEAGTSHQAFVCVGALAPEAGFPGAQAELLSAPAETLGFPVDTVLHAHWVANRDALAQTRKRILDAEHSYQEQARGAPTGPGYAAEEDRELAREYEAILQGGAHPPMLRASISLAVGAADRDELERRVSALREQIGDVAIHRPRGLQRQLFLDHLPRAADGGDTPDYEQQVTVEQFGALMPTATARVGSEKGVYLGWSPYGGGRPVFYDPTEAPRTSRPAGVLFLGTTGSGKTNAAETVGVAGERCGSRVLAFDPKPDHGLDKVPELEGRVGVLELSGAESHRGAIDPMAIAPPDLREELASSYLLELLRQPPASWENAIQRAVRDTIKAGDANLLAVVERLQDSDNEAAREAGDALEVVSDFGLARLGFGSGAATSKVETGDDPITTIRTPGLTLPDPGASRETYTRAERVSVATLSLVAALVLRLVSEDRSQHKIIIFDEAWFLLSSRQGRALLDRLVRLGRANNATVILISQKVTDLADLSALVGVFFCFCPESDAEARQVLELWGRDPDGDAGIRAAMGDFRNGRCLMRDLDGRIGEVQVDLVFDSFREAFDTVPTARAAA